MSAGQSLRRGGYAYGLNAAVHTGPILDRRGGAPDVLSLVFMATIVIVIAAVASDPVLTAAAKQILGTAWSDAVALLSRVVNRAG
jgi:hypothetical protein